VRIVVGLGNPGERYERTRHNVGFMVVDLLASRVRARGVELDDVWVAEARLGDEAVRLVKPLTYMNRSGCPVARVLAETGKSAAELVVIVDDVALGLGRIRVRARGGHGGHNGLRSLVDTLGTEEFPRIRVGIARGELPDDLTGYVLSAFPEEDVLVVQEAVGLAADATECVVSDGPAMAMNRFNGRRG
jgi:PTH1 family peptidyl-tRNA hydrolase